MKIFGITVSVLILALLFLSLFTGVYEFPEDEAAGIINHNGITVLTAIYLLISLLSATYTILNGLWRNKWLVYPILVVGLLCLMRLIYILVFYLEK